MNLFSDGSMLDCPHPPQFLVLRPDDEDDDGRCVTVSDNVLVTAGRSTGLKLGHDLLQRFIQSLSQSSKHLILLLNPDPQRAGNCVSRFLEKVLLQNNVQLHLLPRFDRQRQPGRFKRSVLRWKR